MLTKSLILSLIFLVVTVSSSFVNEINQCDEAFQTENTCNVVSSAIVTDQNGKKKYVTVSLCNIINKKYIYICKSTILESRVNLGDDIYSHAKEERMKLLPTNCGEYRQDRIFGGTEAFQGEFPWMARIHYQGRSNMICGASIINDRHLLTAAHCVKDQKVNSVSLGAIDISKREKHSTVASVKKAIVHKNYKDLKNDIALLVLRKSINFTDFIKPICLPLANNLFSIDLAEQYLTVAGWGKTETEAQSKVLLKASLLVLSGQNCTPFWQNFILGDNICVDAKNKDSCSGDSGGPLMLDEKYNEEIGYRMFQYGIVSYGHKICGNDVPSVYTDVRAHSKWILDSLEV